MLTNSELVEIDGGILEGGGQVLRIAVALSVLRKLPIRVHSIRAGRQKPGLRPQHLTGLEICQRICSGKLIGAKIGSTNITFHPDKMYSQHINADTKTAGSVSLLLQVGLPCALFNVGPTHFQLRGGTNAEMAPHIDYTAHVYKKLLEKFGGTFDVEIVKRGYFPRGGGEVNATVQPVMQLQAVEMTDPGNIDSITGWAFAAGRFTNDRSEEMSSAALSVIFDKLGKDYMRANPSLREHINIEWHKDNPRTSIGDQLGIILFATTSTGCVFGSCAVVPKGIHHKEVAQQAARDLLEDIESGSCVDRWAQDQVIILMALAQGKSRIRCGEITLHTKTAIHIAQLMTGAKFNVIPDSSNYIVECDGIGFTYQIRTDQ